MGVDSRGIGWAGRQKAGSGVSPTGSDRREALLAFFDFPAEHWNHLRTSNPIESVFATVRHRTVRAVRKSLGRQEIAAIQSTVIDQQAGLVRLLTVLAHSSGEWLSSEWPVCAVAETANPQRMGAALTFARRYALFTLVGIAGEDDLDAPHPRPTPAPSTDHARIPGAAVSPAVKTPSPKTNGSRQSPPRVPEPMLAAEDSAALREAMLAELVLVQTTDGLARWAYRRLRSKNILQGG